MNYSQNNPELNESPQMKMKYNSTDYQNKVAKINSGIYPQRSIVIDKPLLSTKKHLPSFKQSETQYSQPILQDDASSNKSPLNHNLSESEEEEKKDPLFKLQKINEEEDLEQNESEKEKVSINREASK